MLSLEKPFREKLLALYQHAPLDAPSFHRHYKVCAIGECHGMCCNGGSGFYLSEEIDTIRALVKDNVDFFGKLGITPDNLFVEELDEETGVTNLSTNIREDQYPPGLLPEHFPSTACIFKTNTGACSLQMLGREQGKDGWWYKPVACWLFPLELEYDGKPFIRVAHASTDEYVDEEYPGFVGYVGCGKECTTGGTPAYKVLQREIAELSRLIDRDLMREIMAYKEAA
jgi:hypothetical protein